MGYIRSDEHAFVRRDIENKILFPGEVLREDATEDKLLSLGMMGDESK